MRVCSSPQLNLLIGNPIILPLLGIAVGHVFYFLHYLAPTNMGVDLIKTPAFLIQWFGGTPQHAQPSGRGGRAAPPPRPYAGHQWGGGGQVLGER